MGKKNCIAGFRLSAILFCLFFIGGNLQLSGQDSIPDIFRKNIIKINFIPVIPALSGQSQQWVGIEYQRYINTRISVSLLINTGIFEDYNYKKYYDFFNQHQGFSYTQRDVKTTGYDLIPAVNYYFLRSSLKPGQGLFAGGKIDINQYFKKSSTYDSQTGSTNNFQFTQTRIGIGLSAGGQYIAWSRLSLGMDLSLFFRVLENKSMPDQLSIPPINAFWKTDEDTMWATVQIMIGYAFGGGKNKKNNK